MWNLLFSDVLELADKKCSGRRECEILVPNSDFDETKPCYKELKVYLEASYTCVKGEHVASNLCISLFSIDPHFLWLLLDQKGLCSVL